MTVPEMSIVEKVFRQPQGQSGTTQESLPRAKVLWVEHQDLLRESIQWMQSEIVAAPIFWQASRQNPTRNPECEWPNPVSLR
jgi:hypothetical protein